MLEPGWMATLVTHVDYRPTSNAHTKSARPDLEATALSKGHLLHDLNCDS